LDCRGCAISHARELLLRCRDIGVQFSDLLLELLQAERGITIAL